MMNELFARLMTWAANARDNQSGQGLVEYALILVLVSIAAIVIMGTLGTTVTGVFTDVVDALTP